MRDVRVGSLPKTAVFRRVVALVEAGGGAAAIVAATVAAAGLSGAARDPVLRDAIATAVSVLRGGGASARPSASRMSVVAAVADTLDAHASTLGRSDVGEIAQLAAIEALVRALPERPRDARITAERFAAFAQELFARFVYRWVLSFLERELPSHVGEGRRFATVEDHARFRVEVEAHVARAARAASAPAERFFEALSSAEAPVDEAAAAFAESALSAIERALAEATS